MLRLVLPIVALTAFEFILVISKRGADNPKIKRIWNGFENLAAGGSELWIVVTHVMEQNVSRAKMNNRQPTLADYPSEDIKGFFSLDEPMFTKPRRYG